MVEILKIFDLTPHDATMIVVWAISFIFLWKVLSGLCWQPLLALIEAREAATVGAGARVAKLTAEAEELARSFDNEIFKARMEGVKIKSVIVQEAKQSAQAKISTAEEAANLAGKHAATELRNKAQAIEKELESQIVALSQQALVKMGIQ